MQFRLKLRGRSSIWFRRHIWFSKLLFPAWIHFRQEPKEARWHQLASLLCACNLDSAARMPLLSRRRSQRLSCISPPTRLSRSSSNIDVSGYWKDDRKRRYPRAPGRSPRLVLPGAFPRGREVVIHAGHLLVRIVSFLCSSALLLQRAVELCSCCSSRKDACACGVIWWKFCCAEGRLCLYYTVHSSCCGRAAAVAETSAWRSVAPTTAVVFTYLPLILPPARRQQGDEGEERRRAHLQGPSRPQGHHHYGPCFREVVLQSAGHGLGPPGKREKGGSRLQGSG